MAPLPWKCTSRHGMALLLPFGAWLQVTAGEPPALTCWCSSKATHSGVETHSSSLTHEGPGHEGLYPTEPKTHAC